MRDAVEGGGDEEEGFQKPPVVAVKLPGRVFPLWVPVLAERMQDPLAEIPAVGKVAELESFSVEAEDSIVGEGDVPGPPGTLLMLCRRAELVPGGERHRRIDRREVGHFG